MAPERHRLTQSSHRAPVGLLPAGEVNQGVEVEGHPEARRRGRGRRLKPGRQRGRILLFRPDDFLRIEGPGKDHLGVGAQGQQVIDLGPLALDLQGRGPAPFKPGNQALIEAHEGIQGQTVPKFPGAQAPARSRG